MKNINFNQNIPTSFLSTTNENFFKDQLNEFLKFLLVISYTSTLNL